jgi:hypothetical protein
MKNRDEFSPEVREMIEALEREGMHVLTPDRIMGLQYMYIIGRETTRHAHTTVRSVAEILRRGIDGHDGDEVDESIGQAFLDTIALLTKLDVLSKSAYYTALPRALLAAGITDRTPAELDDPSPYPLDAIKAMEEMCDRLAQQEVRDILACPCLECRIARQRWVENGLPIELDDEGDELGDVGDFGGVPFTPDPKAH